MSLETPIRIRMLQRKLYQKAKDEPNYRFYLLYDKIWREDILLHAYELAKANKGAPGVDRQSFDQIESEGRQKWLEGIRNDLRAVAAAGKWMKQETVNPAKHCRIGGNPQRQGEHGNHP